MKQWLPGLPFLFVSCMALAAGPSEVRQQTQASMLVTGQVEVAPDGKLKTYTIDRQQMLPASVVELLQKSIPGWEFQPVSLDGQPVTARAKMSLRVVARRVDDQHASIDIEGAHFGNTGEMTGQTVSRKTMEPPRYPEMEVRSHVTGTVYALLKIGRDGNVADAAVEQVNLGVYASEREMNQFRHDLSRATLKALRQWTFNTPTVGKQADAPFWFARVPVNFNLSINGTKYPREAYGKWESYLPGPREFIPWAQRSQLMTGNPDAAPAGGVYGVNQGLTLKTPLAGA